VTGFAHIPVLGREVVELLAPHSGGVYLDATLGGGGHSALLLEATGPDGRVIGFDRDSAAIAAATDFLKPFGPRFSAVNRNFTALEAGLSEQGISAIDGFVFDLGVSSHQLDSGERGFSFQQDAPLDMRMDRTCGESAADIVNSLAHGELARIIREYGEERWAGRIASFICRERESRRIETTFELVDIIKAAIPRKAREERIHPATRTFQALRIAVNDELNAAKRAIPAGLRLLKSGGRGAVISFHSLEDRIVKQLFREMAKGCICPAELPLCCCSHVAEFEVVTGRPVTAREDELAVNPRSRSAKLRVIKKL
jgi:16S rRNA (cytosine1402-N4)-methyltransferase